MAKQPLYRSVVYQEGTYYVAQCLDFDVSSFGDSEQEALANLQEAMELYFAAQEDATETTAGLMELANLNISGGPKDLASQLDHYLYGSKA